MEFKVGDKVKISDSSDYANHQQKIMGIGIIVDIWNNSSITVKSTINDYENSYRTKDLEFVETIEEHNIDDNLEIIINDNLIAITDNDGDMIEVTMEQLEKIYLKCFKEKAKVYKEETPVSYGYDCQCEFCKDHECILDLEQANCTHEDCVNIRQW